MTLTELYRSRPMDWGVAHVGVHTLGSIFMYGNSIASMFSKLYYQDGEP